MLAPIGIDKFRQRLRRYPCQTSGDALDHICCSSAKPPSNAHIDWPSGANHRKRDGGEAPTLGGAWSSSLSATSSRLNARSTSIASSFVVMRRAVVTFLEPAGMCKRPSRNATLKRALRQASSRASWRSVSVCSMVPIDSMPAMLFGGKWTFSGKARAVVDQGINLGGLVEHLHGAQLDALATHVRCRIVAEDHHVD